MLFLIFIMAYTFYINPNLNLIISCYLVEKLNATRKILTIRIYISVTGKKRFL